jgi:predicted regulator of Ras-like GTPase activity (Roadblock/LC7/MglB family)
MNQALDNVIASKSAVTGFLCADSNGLCISAKKDFKEKDAGTVSAIYAMATELTEDSSSSPIIVIEMETKNILIKEYDSMVVAVSYKSN